MQKKSKKSETKKKYPIVIPSKGRSESRFTMKMLDSMGIPYTVFIEENDFDDYAKHFKESQLHIMPQHDQGLVVTRNYIWDRMQEAGYERFWTMDDNIRIMYRLNKNRRIPLMSETAFRAMEDFTERYTNVLISGMNYKMFAPAGQKRPALHVNTRVYSNMLILTDAKDPYGKPYRNEGFYNDDTDLCLRMLKDGYCTLLFNAFLIDKQTTMTVKGGMTPHYQDDGRYKMAKELRDKHPDVTTITKKWGRWQHHVDYRPFRKNLLKRRKGLKIKKGINEYGMTLKELKSNEYTQ